MERTSYNQNSKLIQALFKLGQVAKEKVLDYKKTKKLNSIQYKAFYATEINYEDGIVYYDWDNPVYFDYFYWDSRTLGKFTEDEIWPIKELNDALNAVADEFEVDDKRKLKEIAFRPLIQKFYTKAAN